MITAVLPQVNATLDAVHEPAAGEVGRGAGAQGPQLWPAAGQPGAAAYYRAVRDRRPSPAGDERLLSVELIVSTLDPPIAWRSGLVVTYTTAGETHTGKVKLAPSRDLPGMPAAVRTTRLVLEDV